MLPHRHGDCRRGRLRWGTSSLEYRTRSEVGAMRSYDFVCPPKLTGWRILSLEESYSVSGSALYQWRSRRRKGKLVKFLRKCNA